MGFLNGKPERFVINNRNRFYYSLGVRPKQVARCGQVHGKHVRAVSKIPAAGYFLKTDALITNKPGIFLTAVTADCFPVFFYASGKGAVGIAHAGWRGVVKKIVPETLHAMVKVYLLKTEDVRVAIGPGIRKCHFEVTREVLLKFKSSRAFIFRRGRKIFIDLPGIIRDQLRKAGVRHKNIVDSGECTCHNPRKYFSYRRDKSEEHPKGFGNMISVIGYKK